MKITANDLKVLSFKDSRVLEIGFEGTTSYGERISKFAEYNEEGKMIHCSSASSSMNNAIYYVEVAEYFKAMLDLEGSDKIKETFRKAIEIEQYYDDKKEELYSMDKELMRKIEEINNSLEEIRKPILELSKEILDLIASLKRCRKEESKMEKQKEIDKAKEQIERKKEDIKLDLDELKNMKTKLLIEKREVRDKIELLWHDCKMAIKSVEIIL